jgi:hypothetical protein
MLRTREDYLDLMTFNSHVPPMFVELFGPLVGLEAEWLAQGATPGEADLTEFDFDYLPMVLCGGLTGLSGGIKPYRLEETEDAIIEVDQLGRKTKLCKGRATIALPLEYPVTDMDSWRAIRHWYTFNETRINRKAVEAAKAAQKNGALVLANIPGGFDLPRQLMGEENVCYCYYDDPQLMHDILETAGQTAFKVLESISRDLVIDNLCVHEDMAGKSGSLVGPDHIREFIQPYYRKIWDLLEARGTRLFSQDSDGNMNSVVDAFLDCGVNVMFPAEPAAGMDMVSLRKKYGKRLAFKGGIDKHVLRQDKEAIERELHYKLQPMMREGGVVFGLDHRIPNGTPLSNYRFYVDRAREILGLPKRDENARGWQRMAF